MALASARAVGLGLVIVCAALGQASGGDILTATTDERTKADSVASIRPPSRVAIKGFEHADDEIHMLEWLGKGKDFRQFFMNDLEHELYRQDPGSLLISAECLAKPEYVSKALKDDPQASKAILTEFSVVMPLLARVRASSGQLWRLKIDFGYHMTGMDVPGNRKLQLNFQIVSADAE